jgi:hypothetical protein
MEYIILQDDSIGWLENEVKKFTKDGWKPQGGVSVAIMESTEGDIYRLCAQAMVKEEGGA